MTVCLRAPEGQPNPGGRGGSCAVFGTERGARRSKHPLGAFRGWWRQHGSSSDCTPRAVGLQTHGSPTRRRPHCGSSLWSLEVFSCLYAQFSGQRYFLQNWPKAFFPTNLNHTQWQMDFFVAGFSLVGSILSLLLTWCPHCQVDSLS